jgi:RimJ/RimL family protein N-acetyltransferase
MPIEAHEVTLATGQKIAIRDARPEDAGALIALITDVFAEQRFHISVPEDFGMNETEQRATIEKIIADRDRLLIVAEENGRLLGFLEVERDARQRLRHRATVWMSIAKEVRGHELGTLMGMAAFAWAQRTPSLEKACMQILHTNERSLALTKKFGFVEEARLHREVKIGPGEYADLVILSRTIPHEEDQAAQ